MQFLLTLHVEKNYIYNYICIYNYTMANIAFELENIKHVGKTVRKMSILISQLEGPSSQELM